MRAFLLATLVLLLTGTASAQSPTSRDSRAPSEDITEHTFRDADQVVGDRVGAEGSRIKVRSRLSGTSLVSPRAHFVRELLGSVEDL